MSLAAKCSRAQANMINREQRLQAGGLGLLHTTVYPHPVKSKGWCMVKDAESPEPRGIKGWDLLLHQLTLEEEEEEDGIAGITSHGGLSLLKIRKWYFLFQDEFLWVLFLLLYFREEREVLWYMQESSTERYSMLIYWNVFGFFAKCFLCCGSAYCSE